MSAFGGVKQTSRCKAATSVFDPTRTLDRRSALKLLHTSRGQAARPRKLRNPPQRRHGDRMKRFTATMPVLLIVLLAFATAAATQPAPRVARVGMLCTPSCTGGSWDALVDELRKLGWSEGTTMVIERKETGPRLDELPALAADLVRSKPDLIVAFTPQPVRAAKNATSEIPIVMIFVADPVGVGLVSSLARPDGNLTGVTTLVPGGFMGKTLAILRELLPQAKRVTALTNPSNETARLAIAEGSNTSGRDARLSARRD